MKTLHFLKVYQEFGLVKQFLENWPHVNNHENQKMKSMENQKSEKCRFVSVDLDVIYKSHPGLGVSEFDHSVD